jgi:hypothetical protein
MSDLQKWTGFLKADILTAETFLYRYDEEERKGKFFELDGDRVHVVRYGAKCHARAAQLLEHGGIEENMLLNGYRQEYEKTKQK